MPFKNKIRLPFFLSRPQYPVDENIYRRSDGVRRVTKSIVSKEMNAMTDWLPEQWHERLNIALRHDEVNVTSQIFSGSIRINGTYDIEWLETQNYPIAIARFKAFDETFNASNAACASCDDVSQLILVDDQFGAALLEGVFYNINVASNDKIYCPNPVFAIVSFASDYILNPAIDANGLLTFEVLIPVASVGNIELVRYSVDCGDGQIEEASVFGSISGSLTAQCEPITNLAVAFVPDPMPVAMSATWDAPAIAPANGYNFKLYKYLGSLPTLVTSGNVDVQPLIINSLDYDQKYRVNIAAVCGIGDESPDVQLQFTTPKETGNALAIILELEDTDVGGGLVMLQVRATIPGGLTFTGDIHVINGEMTKYSPTFHVYPFSITIASGLDQAVSGEITTVPVDHLAQITGAEVDPTSMHETISGDLYDLSLTF
jgi:hypothetical protein